uniref:Uncharacterized protein n=1 Tax=Xiphophorus maculatus TaxID=8083 RepID=A0A3B5Q5S5_XIPMA
MVYLISAKFYSQILVLDGQAAAQHLQEHLAEVTRRQVVEERVEHGAEVEAAVGHQVEPRVEPEIRQRPGRLRDGRRHQAPNSVPVDAVCVPAFPWRSTTAR